MLRKVNKEDKKRHDQLDPHFYHLFLLFLKQYPKKQVPSKELISDFGGILDIYTQVKSLIFYSKMSNHKSTKEM